MTNYVANARVHDLALVLSDNIGCGNAPWGVGIVTGTSNWHWTSQQKTVTSTYYTAIQDDHTIIQGFCAIKITNKTKLMLQKNQELIKNSAHTLWWWLAFCEI